MSPVTRLDDPQPERKPEPPADPRKATYAPANGTATYRDEQQEVTRDARDHDPA